MSAATEHTPEPTQTDAEKLRALTVQMWNHALGQDVAHVVSASINCLLTAAQALPPGHGHRHRLASTLREIADDMSNVEDVEPRPVTEGKDDSTPLH
jgi:hypothetical protein